MSEKKLKGEKMKKSENDIIFDNFIDFCEKWKKINGEPLKIYAIDKDGKIKKEFRFNIKESKKGSKNENKQRDDIKRKEKNV